MTPYARRRPSPCPGCATCQARRREQIVTAVVGAATLVVWAYFFLVLLPALAS